MVAQRLAEAAQIIGQYPTAIQLRFLQTLSFVITSCGGTSRTTVLKLTLTILSTIGIINKRPGPFAPINQPSRKSTPLSYSRNTLKALESIIIKKTITTVKSDIVMTYLLFLVLFFPVHLLNY